MKDKKGINTDLSWVFNETIAGDKKNLKLKIKNFTVTNSSLSEEELAKIEKRVYENVLTIMKNTPNINFSPRNVNEIAILNSLAKKALFGSSKQAHYISLMVKQLKDSDEDHFEHDSENIDSAVKFLLISNQEQKNFLVWCFILDSIKEDERNINEVEKDLDLISKHFTFPKLEDGRLKFENFYFFKSFNWIRTDYQIVVNAMLKKIEKSNLPFKSLKDSNNDFWYFSCVIPESLQLAAFTLLIEIGIKFNEEN